MLFSSNVFLFAYLPIVLLLYYAAPIALRNLVLLVVSLIFYSWGEPVYVLLMVGVIALNYAFGLWIAARQKSGKGAGRILALGVAGNLLILGYFKYWGFLLSCLSALFPALKQLALPEVELPIGISFYIFQSMSYIIDVFRQDAQVQRNPISFGTYVALFPQLIAGPIVRYRDVAEQLASRRETVSGFSDGIYLFVLGLCKKVLLANPMGSLWNLMRTEQGMFTGWFGLMAYTLQIYFDFSGYSDMARGGEGCSDFHFWKISTTPIFRPASQSSGADGTFLCPPGSKSMSTSPWEEIAGGFAVRSGIFWQFGR